MKETGVQTFQAEVEDVSKARKRRNWKAIFRV